MKTRIIILAFVALFSFSINAQTEQTKIVKFDISKTLANIEKLSTQNYDVQLKGNIAGKIDATHFWFKDKSGKIKIIVTSEQLTKVGEYSEITNFSILGKIENTEDKTITVSEIKKLE